MKRSFSQCFFSPRRVAVSLFAVLLAGSAMVPTSARAQGATGTVDVVVVDAETEAVLVVSVARIRGAARANVGGGEGRFRITGLASGTYELQVSAVHYAEASRTVEVRAGEVTRITVGLDFLPTWHTSVVVQSTRPDLLPDFQLTEDIILDRNPRDVGELLRKLPGVNSVRRGPLGFDPVVRGMRETQIGVYLDGSRVFPGGPARMDSALSHFDPGAVQNVEVVAGPYALTWGAGNLTAIRARTQEVPPRRSGTAQGDLRFGFDANMNALETVGSLRGRADAVSYWGYGVYRRGDDYEDGNGDTVQADFQSREVRGKFGYRWTPNSDLTFSSGYQQQRNIDYPGRLLDAEYFNAIHVAGNWNYRGTGAVRAASANLYYNDVDHGMNNDNKPTAAPMPGRVPPFPLDILVATGSAVGGGRAAVEFEVADATTLEFGGDFYRSNRNAVRTIDRRDTGTRIASDNPWPDVDIDDYGIFAKVDSGVSVVNIAATVRGDFVRARADEALASDFFTANTTSVGDRNESNVSAAVTSAAPLGAHWMVSGGFGSAVRTADALERYADRFPASKAQFAAEFVGDPLIRPERSNQFDIWIDGRYAWGSLSVSGYWRRVADYITIEATDLPRKLPLSPPTVYRYINGEATFRGLDYRATFVSGAGAALFVRGDYTWGRDQVLDEPALGISPLRASIGGNYAFGAARRYELEAVVNMTARQERVAAQRGETPTPGWATLDLTASAALRNVTLRAGALNLTNTFYINHLNAANPFTARQIPEPGRVFFIKASYAF